MRQISICVLTLLATTASISAQELKDAFGDPLPKGAIARIGTTRYRMRGNSLHPDGAHLSPDGKLIAVMSGCSIELWEVPDWKLRHRIDAECAYLSANDCPTRFFTADSKYFFYCRQRDRECTFIDVNTGKPVKQMKMKFPEDFRPTYPGFSLSADQQTLVYWHWTSKHKEVIVWNVNKDEKATSFEVPEESAGVWPPTLTSDGRALVRTSKTESGAGQIDFWDLKTGKLDRSIQTDQTAHSFAVSPN